MLALGTSGTDDLLTEGAEKFTNQSLNSRLFNFIGDGADEAERALRFRSSLQVAEALQETSTLGNALNDDILAILSRDPAYIDTWKIVANEVKVSTRVQPILEKHLDAVNQMATSHSEVLQKALRSADDLGIDGVDALFTKLKSIEGGPTALLDDMARSDELLEAIAREPGLVDGWQMIPTVSLEHRTNPEILRSLMSIRISQELPMEVVIASKRNIDDFDIAPTGYQLYEQGGRKYIRRTDTSNPNTPRVMVDDTGNIVRYTAPQRLSVSARFKRNLEAVFGPMPAGHQRHHLVPDNVVGSSPLHQEAMKRIV